MLILVSCSCTPTSYLGVTQPVSFEYPTPIETQATEALDKILHENGQYESADERRRRYHFRPIPSAYLLSPLVYDGNEIICFTSMNTYTRAVRRDGRALCSLKTALDACATVSPTLKLPATFLLLPSSKHIFLSAHFVAVRRFSVGLIRS